MTPEGIVQKVSDASGSNYSGSTVPPRAAQPPPPPASKPAFLPTRSSGGTAFNPLAARKINSSTGPLDDDGWGHDAPPVTRSQLEKVQPAYQPTKVNMRELTSTKQEPSRLSSSQEGGSPEVVRGAYQPVGKVDIAAIRRQAQSSKSITDDRPATVKGAYEPVGKVDIAAIRARAQQPSENDHVADGYAGGGSNAGLRSTQPLPISSVGAAYSGSERLTSLPKPKVGNKFGSSTASFTGTKAPLPSTYGVESKSSHAAPIGGASKTFADEGGKTPAQLWAEKKARERGTDSPSLPLTSSRTGATSPLVGQTSGGSEWKSGYTGKQWGAVQTAKVGQSAGDVTAQVDDNADGQAEAVPPDHTGSIKDRFNQAPPTSTTTDGSAPGPPPLETSTKPNSTRGPPMPGLPTRPAQQEELIPLNMPVPPPQPSRDFGAEEEEEDDGGSPIRVAMPVSRTQPHKVEDAREEQFAPPPAMPERSLAQAIPHEDQLPAETDTFDARAASEAMAARTMEEHSGSAAPSLPHTTSQTIGKRAVVQYDYEKAEENEIELHEGEYVTNIDMVDEDWWMGENARGEQGLFPSNYVELVEDGATGHESTVNHAAEPIHESTPTHQAVTHATESHDAGATATALYDYEAAEDNELSFPENAIITNVVRRELCIQPLCLLTALQQFPDEDWWTGEYEGREGLFPANYVELRT